MIQTPAKVIASLALGATVPRKAILCGGTPLLCEAEEAELFPLAASLDFCSSD